MVHALAGLWLMRFGSWEHFPLIVYFDKCSDLVWNLILWEVTTSIQRNNRISNNVSVWNADSTCPSSKMPLTGPFPICEPLLANPSSASGTITKSTIICHLAPLSFTNLSPVPLPADLVNLSQYSLSQGNVLRFSPTFTGTFYTYFSLARLVITEEAGGSFVSFFYLSLRWICK